MSQLPGNDLLAQIENENPKLGQYLRQYLVPSITRTAQNAAVSPTGNAAAPQSPSQISVAAAGEMVHVSLTDNSALNRGVQYFTEISANDPSFRQPIVFHHGTSRTPPPFPLPSKDGSGNPVSYYVRSYSQYPGSPPSTPVVHGGAAHPTAVTLSGATQLNLLPSTGSGTASGNGTQGGQGFGKSPVRL
jgi:hypothetical protein